MTWITRKRKCPACGGNDFYRYHRSLWMRLFSGSQLLRCRICRSRILLLRQKRAVSGDAADQAGILTRPLHRLREVLRQTRQ